MPTHSAKCHCAAVQFHITSDLAEFTTCDCSLCTMRGAVMVKVPDADLTVTAGEGALTLYQWNTRIAKHYFCSNCGIYVFHNKRAAPDHFGVNVRCLTDVSITDAPIRATEGENMSVEKDGARVHWPSPRTT